MDDSLFRACSLKDNAFCCRTWECCSIETNCFRLSSNPHGGSSDHVNDRSSNRRSHSSNGPDSARGNFRRTAEAGRHYQAGQPAGALIAGGGGAERSALRPPASPGVSASLSPETESGGQGGGGAQVSRTTLLDAAHPKSGIQRSFASRAARWCAGSSAIEWTGAGSGPATPKVETAKHRNVA
jgi:hypothetical protein